MLCLISSRIQKESIASLVEKTEEMIKNLRGHLIYKNDLEEKKLAYPIKHERKGYFFSIGFELESASLKKLEEKLKNIPEILRYQIVKVKEFKEKKKERKIPFIKTSEDKEEKINLEKIGEKN